MNEKTTKILKGLLVVVILFLTSFQVTAQVSDQQKDAPITYIKMYVDGLACPFCAYGLEKKIKKLEGVKDMIIEIDGGYITFSQPTSEKPTEEALLKLVEEAGFKARDITYSEKPFSDDDAQ